RGGGRRIVGLARPLDRREPDRDRAGRADQVREQPRQAAEALVERRAEHLLGAVLRDERLDDLVVVGYARIDQRRQLAAHLVRRAARILTALGQRLVAAGAAGADDLVLHLLLERRARVVRRAGVDVARHPLR